MTTTGPTDPYYRQDLALVHHRGFGFHADRCAPGILALLEPVREAGGLVVELGCGSGLLTRHLVEAGHRVVATDASPAMLDLARATVPDAEDLRRLTLPHEPLPTCDAVVSVGHVLSYLPDEAAVEQALAAIAAALRPGGLLAIDLCDLRWGDRFAGHGDGSENPDVFPAGRVGDDWAIFSRFRLPAPNRFVRDMTTFIRQENGCWRRDDETHQNVLIDTAQLPDLLANQGLEVRVAESFDHRDLGPTGLVTVIGRRVR